MATTIPPEANSPGAGANPIRAGWHNSAPQAVRQAYGKGDAVRGWDAWVGHLRERDLPIAVDDLLPGSRPMLWALSEEAETAGTLDLLARLERFGSKRFSATDAARTAADWLADIPGPALNSCWAVEAIGWCRCLPRLATKLDASLWWALVDRLSAVVSSTSATELERDPLIHQLIAGELALTLGYLLPELRVCRKAARGGRRALSLGLVELTDGQGFLHGQHLDRLRPLLASWTRCRAIGREMLKGSWSAKAENQYEWLVRHALRLTRSDGSQVLSNGAAGARCDDLIDAALDLAGNKDDWAIAALALPGRKKKDSGKSRKRKLPKSAYHSPWGETGVLRAGWGRDGCRVTAVYPGDKMRLELESARQVLFSGRWDFEVSRNGQRLEPKSAWTEVCWISDKDIVYFETEIELADGITVQRHIALARQDEFLLLADAVLGAEPGNLEYRGTLPLDAGMSFELAQETREGFIEGKRRAASVLPLALPEWRVDPRVGSLRTRDGLIELCQSAAGRSLFAPLFIDLSPKRMGRPLTWRQLTVGESLEIQPADVAVGYRVQIGRRQWLAYRSLGPKGNRTLLGHNLATELLIARFRRDGEVESLVEIE